MSKSAFIKSLKGAKKNGMLTQAQAKKTGGSGGTVHVKAHMRNGYSVRSYYRNVIKLARHLVKKDYPVSQEVAVVNRLSKGMKPETKSQYVRDIQDAVHKIQYRGKKIARGQTIYQVGWGNKRKKRHGSVK